MEYVPSMSKSCVSNQRLEPIDIEVKIHIYDAASLLLRCTSRPYTQVRRKMTMIRTLTAPSKWPQWLSKMTTGFSWASYIPKKPRLSSILPWKPGTGTAGLWECEEASLRAIGHERLHYFAIIKLKQLPCRQNKVRFQVFLSSVNLEHSKKKSSWSCSEQRRQENAWPAKRTFIMTNVHQWELNRSQRYRMIQRKRIINSASRNYC